MKRVTFTLLVAAMGSGIAQGQITINSLDMYYEAGQSYRAYGSDGEVSVQGLLGTTGGPQTWNFSEGPEELIYTFDYLDPAEVGPIAALFPDAKLVERKHAELAPGVVGDPPADAFLFLEQQLGKGRIAYGFYDPAIVGPLGLDDPAGVFDPPLLDFPESISYGSSWSGSTVFRNSMLGAELRVTYTSTAEVDAYGLIILPKLGFMECIRVNELVETLYEVKFPDFGTGDPNDPGTGGEFTPVATYYVRNYYWMAKNRGIVAQIVSKQSATPPPDEFATAAQFVRMFETNHPTSSDQPWPVTDLAITPGQGQMLLSWTHPLNATRFRLEFSAALGAAANWQEVLTTDKNFALIDMPTSPSGFWRVVSLK